MLNSYIIVPMKIYNSDDYMNIKVPIDFLKLPQYLQWYWYPSDNDAYISNKHHSHICSLKIRLSKIGVHINFLINNNDFVDYIETNQMFSTEYIDKMCNMTLNDIVIETNDIY